MHDKDKIAIDEHLSLEYLSMPDTMLAHVLDSLFDGVFIVDAQRRVLLWNRGAEVLSGFTRDEVVGRTCLEGAVGYLDKFGKPACQGNCPFREALSDAAGQARARFTLRRKNGELLSVVTHVSPLVDRDMNVIGAIEVFRDSTYEEGFRAFQHDFNVLIRKYVSATTYEQVIHQARTKGRSKAMFRDLSILYLDIVEFTNFSERHQADEIVQMLNDIFGICEAITRKHHGEVDKFIGDAIMSTFEDPNEAVECAINILRALGTLNAMRVHAGKQAIHVRIGINSGYVVHGEVGTSQRRDFTVVGDVVNTAARIQSLSESDSLYISEATFIRLKKRNLFTFYREVTVKGKHQSIKIFRLLPEALKGS